MTAPGQVLAALKAAAPRLGISPRLVHALDWLFRFTQPQDWQEGRRPIVWSSAAMQRDAIGLSPTQVKEINCRLIDLGLVTMKNSPNGKRYGQRDPRGQIVEAYGFDLSPLAARHAEFVRLAEEARAERVLMGRLRRRARIARKGIVQIIETVAEYGFAGEEWQRLARGAEALTQALRDLDRPDAMEAAVKSLETRQNAAREHLESLLKSVDSDPKGAENQPHQYSYKPNPDPNQDTVNNIRTMPSSSMPTISARPTPTITARKSSAKSRF